MTRDSQRQAVYLWEHTVWKDRPDPACTLEECQEIVSSIWEDYRPGSRVPTVTDGRGCRRAYGNRHRISLPVWARTYRYILHELAHSLTFATGADHGPLYATTLVGLWERYVGIPRNEARRAGIHQKPRRVRFATAAACPKPASRAMRAWSQEMAELKKEKQAIEVKIQELRDRRPV